MLSKNELAREIEDRTGIKPNLVKRVLDSMAEIATEEISAGNDFSVPGIVRITWAYTKALAKGERWHKGDTVVGFGGIESEKDADSPARKAAVKLKAAPAPALKRVAPKKDTMSRFMQTRAGKAIAARKG